jgi:hypothetical protein
MKQLLLIAALLFVNAFVFAHSPSEDAPRLKKEIKKKISYPDFAKESKLHGEVRVHFVVKPDGNIEVKQINSSHEHLADHVIRQLEQIVVNDRQAIGDHYAKFSFRFVEM